MRLPILACTFGLLLGSYSLAQDSVESYVDQLPKGETAVRLFNGKDLTGWQGDPKRWSVSDGRDSCWSHTDQGWFGDRRRQGG